MIERIKRLFSLSDTEAPRALALSALFMLIMGGIEFGRTGRDGFFLKEAGPDKIPYMYVLNAAFMFIISFVYGKFVDRVSRYKVLLAIQLFAAAVLVVLRFLIPFGLTFTPFVLFCLVESVILTSLMHFWTLSNSVFDPREGKRIFPLLGASGLIGTIIGGLLTKTAVPFTGTPNLLLVWAVLLVVSAFVAMWIRRVAPEQEALSLSDGNGQGFFQSTKALWSLPLLRTLALMALPMWMVIYLIEYNYYTTMNAVFSNQDELSGFLALFASFCSFGGLLLELFLAGLLLSRVGVGSTTLAYPFTLTIGAVSLVAFTVFPELQGGQHLFGGPILVAFARFCDIAIYFSIYESASQLLFNALPEQSRGQGRALIQGMMMPASTAMAGLLLLFMNYHNEPTHNIAFVSLNLAFLLVIFGLNIGPSYMKAMLLNLNSRDADLQNEALSEFGKMENTETRFVLMQSVSTAPPDEAAHSLGVLVEMQDEELADDLAEILTTVKPAVQEGILLYLADAGEKKHASVARPLLGSEYPGTRSAAARALGRIGNDKDIAAVKKLLDDDDPGVRVESAAVFLHGKPGFSPREKAFKIITEAARSRSPDLNERAARAVAYAPGAPWIPFLVEQAGSKEPLVRTNAIRAMAGIPDMRILTRLIGFLSDPVLRESASTALVEMGAPAADRITAELRAVRFDPDSHAELIRVLGRMGRPESIPILIGFLENRAVVIQDATIDALLTLKDRMMRDLDLDEEAVASHFPAETRTLFAETITGISTHMVKNSQALPQLEKHGRPMFLLVDAIRQSNRRREQVLLSCLGLLTDTRAVQAARSQMAGGDKRAVAEAMEIIEGLGEVGRGAAAALEAIYLPENLQQAAAPLPAILEKILKHEVDPWFRACAVYAAGQMKIIEMAAAIRPLAADPDPFLRDNAQLALSRFGQRSNLKPGEVKAMSLMMDKILFLRSVPLLEELEGRELDWLRRNAREVSLKKGDSAYREGEAASTAFVVLSGRLRAERGQASRALHDISERQTFGEESVLESSPRTHSVMALGDAHLLEIRASDLQRLMHSHPRMAMSICRALATRIHQLEEVIAG